MRKSDKTKPADPPELSGEDLLKQMFGPPVESGDPQAPLMQAREDSNLVCQCGSTKCVPQEIFPADEAKRLLAAKMIDQVLKAVAIKVMAVALSRPKSDLLAQMDLANEVNEGTVWALKDMLQVAGGARHMKLKDLEKSLDLRTERIPESKGMSEMRETLIIALQKANPHIHPEIFRELGIILKQAAL